MTTLPSDRRIKATARRAFVALAWQGGAVAELQELAGRAGLASSEANKILAEIERGKQDRLAVVELPKLRQAAEASRATLETVRVEQRAIIAAAVAEIERAEGGADAARAGVIDGERAAGRLYVLASKKNLPQENWPPEIRQRLVREARDGERTEVHRRWVAAKDRVAAIRAAREPWRERLRQMSLRGVSMLFDDAGEHTRDSVEARLAKLDAQLAEAGEALEAARGEAEKAGIELPEKKTHTRA